MNSATGIVFVLTYNRKNYSGTIFSLVATTIQLSFSGKCNGVKVMNL